MIAYVNISAISMIVLSRIHSHIFMYQTYDPLQWVEPLQINLASDLSPIICGPIDTLSTDLLYALHQESLVLSSMLLLQKNQNHLGHFIIGH